MLAVGSRKSLGHKHLGISSYGSMHPAVGPSRGNVARLAHGGLL